ncbi:alpha-L-fucosidase, partial [Akkermansia muciniphila]
QYTVMTTKHHDGFALFDTATTDYDAKDKKGRDLVREYVDAIRKQGLKVGFYHSVIDWHQQDYDNTICPDLCYPKNQIALLK